MKPSQRISLLVILALLAGPGAIFFAAQHHGAGLSPDSVKYIAMARNLADGHGLSLPAPGGGYKPATHYPPLYPTLLVFGGWGVDPLKAAVGWNALFGFANLLLISAWIRKALPGAFLTQVLAMLIFAVSPAFLSTHTMVWSEPFFLFTGFLGLFLLAGERDALRIPRLIAAGALLSLCALVRFPGVFFMAAGGLYLLLPSARKPVRRLVDTAVFSAACLSFFCAWLVRNLLVADQATSRELAFHPITSQRLEEGFIEVASWLLPWRWSSLWTGLLVIGGLAVVFWICRRRLPLHRPDPAFTIQRLCGLTAAVYLVGLFASITFFDAHTTLRSRILSPAYICLLVALSVYLSKACRRWPRIRIILMAGLALWLPFSGYRGVKKLVETRKDGIGYAHQIWQSSPLMERVRTLPEGALLASNAPDAIGLLADRRAGSPPIKHRPNAARDVENYDQLLMKWHQDMAQQEGLIAWFDQVDWRAYLPTREELTGFPFIKPLYREADGIIFYYLAAPE